MSARRIAVVGAGVSGLTAAYLLSRSHEITLFEAEDRLGGHAHTHDVPDGAEHVPVDSGFIVHNDRTYPLLTRLFEELGVQTRDTEMSMSIVCEECGLQYAGGRGAAGIFGDPRTVRRPSFWRLLLGVRRFHARAAAYLATAPEDDVTTLGEWLAAERFDTLVTGHYVIPVVSCVWSSGHDTALEYPARYLFEFLDHHGMLAVTGSPRWRTVVGGSREYVRRIEESLADVRKGAPVRSIRRAEGVEISTQGNAPERFDAVVIATHSDQALALLADPTDAERDVLGSIHYTPNRTVLHTDERHLPTAAGVRSSWNYRTRTCRPGAEHALVTYWMNRLQGHVSAEQHLVTLNADVPLDPRKVIARMEYAHPQYTPASRAAQRRLPELATATTVYAGAYHGWGFHEDGCRSGVEAAAHLGVAW